MARTILAVFVVMLFACAPPEVVVSTADRPSIDELTAQVELDIREFSAIKGFAKVTYRQNGDRKSAEHVIIAGYPDRLRLETLSLFGSPLMMAATDGGRSVMLFPGEGLAYVGPAGTGFLRKLARLPITTKMIVSIILRRPDILKWQDISIEYLPDGTNRLTLVDGRLSQQIDYNQRRQMIRVVYLADDKVVSTIHYSDYAEGFPGQVDLEMRDGNARVTLDFSDLETNSQLDAALFRLTPSSAYKILPIPDSY
jgi:hypothetical protein